MKLGFWLRWAARDLRQRWLQVAAIAVIIAFGTGMFAAFGGQDEFRRETYDHNYNLLHMYDVRVELADGSFIDGQEVTTLLSDIDGLSTVETRLVTPTLIDASNNGETIMVSGEIVGVPVANGGPNVNSIWVGEGNGRTFTEADSGANVVILEQKFAIARGLSTGMTIRVSGDVELEVVGLGLSPEYWVIVPDTGGFFAESTYGVLFLPLETAQSISDRAGLVNEVIVLIDEGADRDAVQSEIESRLAGAFPDVGFTTNVKEEDTVYLQMYNDIEGDQVFFNMMAVIFLLGASFGAFNLAGRIVESQRRQIGISMALGVPRLWIAFRPLLIGLQIAVIGTILGFLIGIALGQGLTPIMEEFVPMPEWTASVLEPSSFLLAAVMGIVLPMIATLIPVWRAVRVEPLDAIQTGYLVAKGGGLTRMATALPRIGNSFVRMPIQNVLANPWRTLLTVLGIGIAIALMVYFVGLYDSFNKTIDRGADAYLYTASDRLIVNLDFFYPADSAVVTNIQGLTDEDNTALFDTMETSLLVGGRLLDGGEDTIETIVEFHDMANAIWTPALLEGALTDGQPSIVLSQKAAQDLGVGVGDTVRFEHPRREGLMSFRNVETELVVAGIHNNPMRAFAYMDNRDMNILGATDIVNQIVVIPAEGVSVDQARSILFAQPGVTSINTVQEFAALFDEVMDLFVTFIIIAQVIVLFIAFLIAFNTTSINVDERQREVATMFAFGLPVLKVTRMQVLENLITGTMGIIAGSLIGWVLLVGSLELVFAENLPDIKLLVTITPQSLLISSVLGILVVALVPLLSIRKMMSMDVPSTLRVME